MTARRTALLFLAAACCTWSGRSQIAGLRAFRLGESGPAASAIVPSNSISQIAVAGSTLWIGTSKGVSRTADGGASWTGYRSVGAFASDGIFALAATGDTIWASTGYEMTTADAAVQTGSGFAFSLDNGGTWEARPQPLDGRGDSIIQYGINDSVWILPIVVAPQNVTFDISLSPGAVWIASWSSGLRKSTDNGAHWERTLLPPYSRNTLRPTDTLWAYAPNDSFKTRRIFERFDPRCRGGLCNNNMLAFSVLAVDSDTIWCGTAGGVNKSTDKGVSWQRFTHRNQASPILGNWVIAIAEQRLPGVNRIWTTNWIADDPDEAYGVSMTEDGGRTWRTMLRGTKAYDFAFRDSIAYIATDDGVYRTADGGSTFENVRSMTDPASRNRILFAASFAAGVAGDTVYVGTSDGLASSRDNSGSPFGSAWRIFRSYAVVGATGETYAYPNPFSPAFGPARIHYGTSPGGGSGSRTVSIELFDFAMNRVRTLVLNASRDAAKEYDEIWDGTADDGAPVPNGVYFYRIKTSDAGESFGKILIVQ